MKLTFNVDANALKKARTAHYAGTLQQWLTNIEKTLQGKVSNDPTLKYFGAPFPDEYYAFADEIRNILKERGFHVVISNSYEDGTTIQLTW